MKLSSRWSVTGCVAFCALGCSDPVAPPAQGAFSVRVTSASPAPAGKMCPSGASTYFEVPTVPPVTTVDEALDETTYLHWIVDGENAAAKCTVQGNGSFFEGRLNQGTKTLDISAGTLDASLKGTARITVASGSQISGALSSPSANCVINASNAGGTRFEVAPGRIWASFSCPSVEQQPSDYCAARGFFVMENCNK